MLFRSATFYTDWTKADIIWNKSYGELEIEKPDKLEEMLGIASLLSQDFSFVRVDLYTVRGEIYFSELTFTPNSGLERDLSYEWDKKLGEKFSIRLRGKPSEETQTKAEALIEDAEITA